MLMSRLPLFIFMFLFSLSTTAIAQKPETEVKPETAPDDTWISFSGTVETVSADRFTVNYDGGTVIVEFDDGDRDADAYVLDEGDQVTVTGIVDDDLYETRTIEASSVYVESIGTYFYASAADEEDVFVTTITYPIDPSLVTIQGTVTEVSDEEFTIDTGARRTVVEVEDMAYNPLDDIGYQQIDIGDRVSVTGEVDYDLFEGREFVADAIITLSN